MLESAPATSSAPSPAPSPALSYKKRRGELRTYFDDTAVEAWARLTSDAPVGRVRATVRAGRDRMRACLLSGLPQDMSGQRVLDAGCGTGALALEAARRGADVLAVDLSPKLVALAARRCAEQEAPSGLEFQVGDMLDDSLGRFDHVVAMDSLIHYDCGDILAALSALAPRVRRSLLVTFAPRTPALAMMHAVGRMIPRASHRAPAIQPVSETRLRQGIAATPALSDWVIRDTHRVSSGFYTSQALFLERRCGK